MSDDLKARIVARMKVVSPPLEQLLADCLRRIEELERENQELREGNPLWKGTDLVSGEYFRPKAKEKR